jgi:hypothetical protein
VKIVYLKATDEYSNEKIFAGSAHINTKRSVSTPYELATVKQDNTVYFRSVAWCLGKYGVRSLLGIVESRR